MNLAISINSVGTIWASLSQTPCTGDGSKYRACDISAVESQFICGKHNMQLCLESFPCIYKHRYILAREGLIYDDILRITLCRTKHVEMKVSV